MNSRPVFLRPLDQSFTPYREMLRWRRRFWLSIGLWVGLVFFLVIGPLVTGFVGVRFLPTTLHHLSRPGKTFE
jgi:hypothetical protein